MHFSDLFQPNSVMISNWNVPLSCSKSFSMTTTNKTPSKQVDFIALV